MLNDQKEKLKGKVFPKGQVVIPVGLRKKYNIRIGDAIDFVLSDEGILMKPSTRSKDQKPVAEKLFGIFSVRKKKKEPLSRKDVLQATEKGFTEGWQK